MDWDRLRVFKVVADVGSFTHAGDVLDLSQSAVSRQISTLEKSLKVPLFHRHARGLVLTEQGDLLYETTCAVFEELQKVQIRLSDSRELAEGALKITTVEFIASTWLAPQLPVFLNKYPDIQVQMFLDDRVYDMNKREADVALRLYKSDHNDLIERHMTTLDFVLCASKHYIEQHGAPPTKKHIQDHMTIGYPPFMHTPFANPNRIFSDLGIAIENNPKMILINSMHARYTAIKNGTGISVLPKYIAMQDDDLEILFPDMTIPSVDLFFVYPQERRNSKRIAVLKDFLFQHVNQNF